MPAFDARRATDFDIVLKSILLGYSEAVAVLFVEERNKRRRAGTIL